MDIRCKKCNQKYHLSEDQLKDRHIFFNCEKCDYKIVIDMRKERWSFYKPFQTSILSIKDILEGIYFSFNLKNVLTSFIMLIILTFSVAILYLIAAKNMVLFSEHPAHFGILYFIFSIILIFFYDIHLYLISKNVYHRIDNNFNLKFSSIASEIFNDLKTIFILSIGILIIFALLFFPVFLMNDWYGVIYEGVFHSINIILLFTILFIVFTKNIIYSFVAFRTRSFRNNFSSIFKFIAVENINIPAYIVIFNVITAVISSILFSFIFLALLLIAFLLLAGLPGEVSSIFGKFMSSGPAGLIDSFFKANLNIISSIRGGMILISVSTSIVLLFVTAFVINLHQTLSAVSIYIMETNPGRSVNKKILIASILILIVIILSFLMKGGNITV